MTGLLHGGAYAVFALMALDALLPVGGELIMLYAGALAAGAIAGQEPVLLGWHPATGVEAYVVLALAGTLGYLFGSLIGWEIGRRGGRPLLERHGRRLHVDADNLAHAEAWFERWGDWAVFVGRVTPLVRSFISIPSGVLGSPLGRYTTLTLAGSAIWCFGFAAAGWALGNGYERLHHSTRFADYAVVLLAVVAGVAALLVHRRRGRQEQRAS
jgi:membrane protein DedA with SNARE-associated domain